MNTTIIYSLVGACILYLLLLNKLDTYAPGQKIAIFISIVLVLLVFFHYFSAMNIESSTGGAELAASVPDFIKQIPEEINQVGLPPF